MFKMTAKLQGTSPYLYSKVITSVKGGESHQDFEEKVWIERAHVDGKGQLQVPTRAIKGALTDTAQYMGETIPGKGKSTYTKRFKSGIRFLAPFVPMLDGEGNRIKIDDRDKIEALWAFVPSNGKPGDGSRVWKAFPKVSEWSMVVDLMVLDEIIKPEKLKEYIAVCGQFQGIGTWRPSRGGEYGSFILIDDSVEIKEVRF